jgi:predicted MPP superfamily phosphohydrolase
MKFDNKSKGGFLVIFVLIFSLINYQPLAIIFMYFGIKKPLLLSLLIALTYMLFHMLGSKYTNRFAAILYTIATTWLGTIFIAWSITVCLGFVSIFYTPPVAISASIIGFGAIALSLLAFYFGHSLTITNHTIRLEGLNKRIKIVHLSDLHLNGIEARNELSRIITRVAQVKPDIIVITGDLLDVPGLVDNTILQQFNQFDVPVLMVSGNHDRYLGIDKLEKALADTKIKVLRGESWNWNNITFYGLDDSDDAMLFSKKLPDVTGKNPHILLYHKPNTPEIAAQKGYSMMLSGHTHNGQIFPFTLIVRMAYKHIKGLYKVGKMWLYVSQGTGTWAVPMRLGSRDEIAVFNLTPHNQ